MNALIIFAKYPKPSKVKTRLGKSIGNKKAAELAHAFLEDLIVKFSKQRFDLIISTVSSNGSLSSFSKSFPNSSITLQRGNGLGRRMYNCFEDMLQVYDKVVIIGADVPQLPLTVIKKAFATLKHKDIVFGPSSDGGYYLVGMKRPHAIFSNITWSTSTVLKKTLQQIKKKKLSYTLLSEYRDIDTLSDLIIVKKTLHKKDAPKSFDVLKTIH